MTPLRRTERLRLRGPSGLRPRFDYLCGCLEDCLRCGVRDRLRRCLLAFCVSTFWGCVDRPPLGIDETLEGTPVEQLVASSWVGLYDGWGTMEADGESMSVADLLMRITFDADSIRKADCPECLTVSFEPWFSGGNFPFALGASAFLQYTDADVVHSMSIQRFSGGGVTANSLLVELRHERPGPGGTETLFSADLEFRQR